MNEEDPIEVEVLEVDGSPPPPRNQTPEPQPAKPLWQNSLERLLSGEARTLGCLGTLGLVLVLVLGAFAALTLLVIRGVFRAIGNFFRALPGS